MNKMIIMGRLTRNPEMRYAKNGELPIARYSLAVDRPKKENGTNTDFFNLVAFDRAAVFAENYLRKGMKLLVTGHVQTGSYNKNGMRIPTFEVVVENQEFAESKAKNEVIRGTPVESNEENEFMELRDDDDDAIPFS